MVTCKVQGQGCKNELTRETYRIAQDWSQREAAFKLVYDSYLQSGLVQPNLFEMRILPHHLLPTTDLFVGLSGGQVTSTVTLVGDGRLGLPIDEAYSDEVETLRRRGRILGEVSCLANAEKTQVHRCMELFRLMVQAARYRGIDALVVAVHPRHARFYEKFLAFETIGGQVRYPAVCNQPAVSLLLDFFRIDRELPANYGRFFGEPLSESLLRPCLLDEEERQYLRFLVNEGAEGGLPAPQFAAVGDAWEGAAVYG